MSDGQYMLGVLPVQIISIKVAHKIPLSKVQTPCSCALICTTGFDGCCRHQHRQHLWSVASSPVDSNYNDCLFPLAASKGSMKSPWPDLLVLMVVYRSDAYERLQNDSSVSVIEPDI